MASLVDRQQLLFYPAKQMGLTHTMTSGDNISLNSSINNVNVKLFNQNVGDVVRNAAKSVENRYDVDKKFFLSHITSQ